MLNEDYKKQAVADLENANREYIKFYKMAVNNMTRLHQSRQTAVRTIRRVEQYIISLANRPREYSLQINDIKLRYESFEKRIEEIRSSEENISLYQRNAGGGALIGVGSAMFAPTAAMAVAMTFGTASTGTAIATLSGAAATNAALAWLGGGALAVGGAGVMGGQALLTMAGPIGWVIGGVSISSGFILKAISNKSIADKAEKASKTIMKEMHRIQKADQTVQLWNKETVRLSNELMRKLTALRQKKDYDRLTQADKQEMIILMNTTEVLSKKLGDTIHE